MNLHLKASNGQYMSAQGGGGGAVVADRNVADTWETFTVYDRTSTALSDGDQINLAAFHGQFLCAENGGGSEVDATRIIAHEWETFTISRIGGGGGQFEPGAQVSLRAFNGSYVSAQGGGGAGVTADAARVGPYETFTIEFAQATAGPYEENFYRIHLPELPSDIEPESLMASTKS